ncbi:TetR/AcrR family transcriptional regulator [Nocardioides jiangxiensis]|uniref:TetR/AcrR family transcriptional regulator n=1 Tax=Nocardioides jiangxiensis TaxID=3064524 RepID=A0ABT9B592_9ACTN|nr:TetR/AcrR family transcriptional regulator [Nocardioides sp. WY-20]MDO7868772.1 TetR/AcrR family transcriptional regulator [Nocardioides sp. WY-20]
MAEQIPAADGSRRRLSAGDRRDQIVATATDVFIERGYQGTSLEDIAARAGITRPLIYHYFRDKDTLYLEILTRARAALDAAIVDHVPSDASPEAQLRGGIEGYFHFVQEHMHLWELLFGGGTAVAGAVAEEATRQRFETSEKIALLVSAAAPDEPALRANAYAHAISGAGEALTRWWQHHPEVTLEQIVELHMDTVWRGLGPVLDSLG